jgi:hypothetical protein
MTTSRASGEPQVSGTQLRQMERELTPAAAACQFAADLAPSHVKWRDT